MQIDANIHGDRIAYDYPYADVLNEDEESLYWSATQEAEDAISKIAKLQERRKGEDGEIRSVLLSDEFRELQVAIEQLEDAITTLHLTEKAAEWSDQRNTGSDNLGELFQEDR